MMYIHASIANQVLLVLTVCMPSSDDWLDRPFHIYSSRNIRFEIKRNNIMRHYQPCQLVPCSSPIHIQIPSKLRQRMRESVKVEGWSLWRDHNRHSFPHSFHISPSLNNVQLLEVAKRYNADSPMKKDLVLDKTEACWLSACGSPASKGLLLGHVN